ncbi:BQ5605_C035g11400 [Microbotryum silenes-dioicae]|uniref:BQ5605_C035g11400 protein n=1 Tax=Microbotryum silenes-dioicae TaxID=796604 RepID=A0A2X0N9A2_9BASI|nr:BQ5605_C035g11400 [Microbotryum silenes-dioicae]
MINKRRRTAGPGVEPGARSTNTFNKAQRRVNVRAQAPPSLPIALRAFERDFLSRAGFVPGARDWEV